MLDEFTALTGYHRKHAMRLLQGQAPRECSRERPERRRYGPAMCKTLIVFWEASDRICGKRLKPLLPILVASMEHHGHLVLDASVREELLQMSAATIDRNLREVRDRANGLSGRRRLKPMGIRASVPIRTFNDWNDPARGFCEADLVAHSGPVTNQFHPDPRLDRDRKRLDRVRASDRAGADRSDGGSENDAKSDAVSAPRLQLV
jgi:hypothetical protein